MSTSLTNSTLTLNSQILDADTSGVILTSANLSQYCETFASQNNPVNKQFSADTTDNGNNPKNKTESFTLNMGQYCNLQLRAYVYEYRKNESGDGDPTYWYQMNGVVANLASGGCNGVASWSYPLHKASSSEKTCPTRGVAYTPWRSWTIHRTS